MTESHEIAYVIFLIFSGTAVLSTLALYTRQSLLVAYIVLGMLFGPWGLKLVNDSNVISQVGTIGIVFLLFLLGLDLQPQNLFHSLRKMSLVTLSSSILFFIAGFEFSAYYGGYSYEQSILVGVASMFSSTIIGIKLLPTTTLHHQHTGELLISVLLLQDVVAIATLLTLQLFSGHETSTLQAGLVIAAFPVLLLVAYVVQRYILSPLLARFDKIHEYIFILSVGWCLTMAELGHFFGLSEEIGAFIAGVALASHPISYYIVEHLKPLRDFFLVIFFFTIGAGFNFDYFSVVIVPASILALIILIIKPLVFCLLLNRSGEVRSVSWEIGVRLGQMSEFSLLIVYLALGANLLTPTASAMLEAAVILTFMVSCYWTVLFYPTPLAVTDKLRRD